jgi:hypothetical protein
MKVSNGGSAHGAPRNSCGAERRAGGSCKKSAGWGTDHPGYGNCKLHGGSTPNGRTYAERLVARDAVERMGLPVDVQPHVALLQELHRAAGAVAYLEDIVQELADHELWAHVGGGEVAIPRAAPSIWVSMWQTERKMLVAAAQACLSAGVEERRVRMAEQTGAAIGAAFRMAFERLGVLNHPDAPAAMREALMAAASDEAPM